MRANLADRAFMTDHFRRHEAEVRAAIPAERLLVYEAGQGWAPLCAFLGVPEPDAPYPSENSREEFAARSRAALAAAAAPSGAVTDSTDRDWRPRLDSNQQPSA